MKKRRSFKSDQMSQNFWGYVFLIPALTILVVFMLMPIIQIFYYSLTNWNGGFQADFIGLKNYISIFQNSDFYTVLKNNLIILILGVPLWTLFPLVIATFLFEEVKGYKIFKTVYFFPSVLSIVIVGTLFKTLFGYTGPINQFLKLVGLEQYAIEWLAQGSTSLPIVVTAVNWAGFGAAVLIYLAGMSAIDLAVYEAAELDGVTWWQKTHYITFPMMKNVIQFTIVVNITHAFSQMFAYVLVMTKGGPGYESTVLEYFIYLKGFASGDMGYAAALSVVLFCLVLLITFFQNILTNKKEV